jgi:hypothetical protein
MFKQPKHLDLVHFCAGDEPEDNASVRRNIEKV